MQRRLLILFLLLLIGGFSYGNLPSQEQGNLNPNDSIKKIQIVDIILHGNELLAKQKYDSAIISYAYADSLSVVIQSFRLQASSKHNIGLCYFRIGEYIKCKEFFERAIELSEMEGDEVNLAQYLLSMGVLYKKHDVYSKSLEYILKSLIISEKLNNLEMMASAYNSLAGIQKLLGNYKEALGYYHESMIIYTEKENQIGIASVYNNLGNVFQLMDSLELSKEYYHKSLDIKQIIKAEKSTITSLINLGECCLKLDQLDSTQFYYLKALEISEQVNHSSKIGFCLNALGELSIKTNQYDSASKYLERARIIATDYQINKLLLNNYRISIDLFANTNHYQEAYKFSELYNTLNKELYNQEKTKGMNELRFQYETDKKDHMIITLNQINDLKNRSILFISIALIVIALLSIGLFFAYKQKKDAHAYIQLLMHESRHRTKNNLQLLSSILGLHSDQVSIEHRDAVMSAEYRVQSIVLLNKQLDLDESKGRISLSEYFKNLTEGLMDAYTTNDQIQFQASFADIRVLPHQATHLGLIVNELITNSLKYAFNNTSDPIIKMESILSKENICKLIIQDNGCGLIENWNEKAESSLGLSLVQDLCEQLNGDILIENRNGFYFQLVFKFQ